jgi:hypothetical protein
MPFAPDYDALLAELPADWDLFEAYVLLDDPRRLTDARVALARANARPVKGRGDHDFAITVANTRGRGAAAGVVRSALRTLDSLGVTGYVWFGEAFETLRPAPAHRYGP